MQTITTLPALSDNYIYVIQHNTKAAVVDPGQAEPVLRFLKEKNLELSEILITHNHFDHIGGVEKLQHETGCIVVRTNSQIQNRCTKTICHSLSVEVIPVPGHTKDHVAFYIPESSALFTGDTLFAAGCGRIFEGTPKTMFESLQKLASFEDKTLVYFGHEYTEENLQFAELVDPKNEEIKVRQTIVKNKLSRGEFSTPATLEDEKKTNPFLRTNNPSIRKKLQMETASDVEVFAKLRRDKDVF